jgi:RNA polymerase sigma-70 factor (ECF subfamily)
MEANMTQSAGSAAKNSKKYCDISVEVLEALRRGEEWAFNEVYMTFALPLKNFIAKLIQNEEDAMEINHDIFAALWTGRSKIVPEKGIRRLLYVKAKNRAMDYFDHRTVKQKYVKFISRSAGHDTPTDLLVIGREARNLVETYLHGLSEQKQNIFRLRHEADLSVEEIADRLHLSRSTIKNNLSMITKSLRKLAAF